DQDAAVGVDDEEPRRERQVGGEPTSVVDGATGNNETHPARVRHRAQRDAVGQGVGRSPGRPWHAVDQAFTQVHMLTRACRALRAPRIVVRSPTCAAARATTKELSTVQRLLAVLLVLIGLVGLGLGRLGETVWAPATETTATVDLADPGPAVVIDPGVLYVGGTEGEVVIEGASDVSVITASNSDIEAYLEGTHYTRVTGASDWTTLSTEDMNPEGEAEIKDPTSSDLWRSVDTSQSPATIDVHEFWAGENGENEQVYRALLIVT